MPAHLRSKRNANIKRTVVNSVETDYPEGVYALSDQHRDHLRGSGLSDEMILERGYLSTSKHGVTILESLISEGNRRPGIIYPQYLLGDEEPHHYEIRPDEPRVSKSGKPMKYVRPSGVSQIPDVLPRFKHRLGDPSVPIYITEGVKKADALSDLDLLTICLPGVYGFRSKNSSGGTTYHPELREGVAWKGREVILAFDGDWETNRNVHQALQRLSTVLSTWGANVNVLHLPNIAGRDKVGVDDYLVQFDRADRIERLQAVTKPLVMGVPPGDKIGVHPETKRVLYNPPGFVGSDSGTLSYCDPKSEVATVVYNGDLAVIETGLSDDGLEMLTVRFKLGTNIKQTVRAPRSELIRAKGVLDHLGAAGAIVHESNARILGRYISEFASLNHDALPRRTFTRRLGVTPRGIIGPTWHVGEPATYIGKPLSVTVKADRHAYKAALEMIAGLDGDAAWVMQTVIGLFAASPHLDCLNLVRNPVVAIAAPSNLGKSTLARFATGLYMTPAPPMALNGTRSTLPGILQVMNQLNGLPLWIDEAHRIDDEILVNFTYSFANMQTYTRGGKDGVALGGEALRGTLLLTGEGLANLQTTGARNRILAIDGTRYPVLGSRDATDLVAALNLATETGGGSLGMDATSYLWSHRDAWETDIQRLAHESLDTRAGWQKIAAAAQVTLQYLYWAFDLDPGPHADGLSDAILRGIDAGWRNVDPALDAFNDLRDIVLSSEMRHPQAQSIHAYCVSRDRTDLAWLVSIGDGREKYWAVRSTASEVDQVLKQYGGRHTLPKEWQRRGLLNPGSTTSTKNVKIHGATIRCFVFKQSLFEGWDE